MATPYHLQPLTSPDSHDPLVIASVGVVMCLIVACRPVHDPQHVDAAGIETQPTLVIALLVFGLCYVSTAVIFAGAAIISPRSVAIDLKATSPAMLTPLAVILGLLIAFLASRVWSNVDRANAYVGQEASAIHESILLADALQPDARTAMRGAIWKHLKFIEAEDWPAMLEGRASLRGWPPGLMEAMTTLLSFDPAGPGQQIVRQRALVAIEQALEARRNRIMLSQVGRVRIASRHGGKPVQLSLWPGRQLPLVSPAGHGGADQDAL